MQEGSIKSRSAQRACLDYGSSLRKSVDMLAKHPVKSHSCRRTNYTNGRSRERWRGDELLDLYPIETESRFSASGYDVRPLDTMSMDYYEGRNNLPHTGSDHAAYYRGLTSRPQGNRSGDPVPGLGGAVGAGGVGIIFLIPCLAFVFVIVYVVVATPFAALVAWPLMFAVSQGKLSYKQAARATTGALFGFGAAGIALLLAEELGCTQLSGGWSFQSPTAPWLFWGPCCLAGMCCARRALEEEDRRSGLVGWVGSLILTLSTNAFAMALWTGLVYLMLKPGEQGPPNSYGALILSQVPRAAKYAAYVALFGALFWRTLGRFSSRGPRWGYTRSYIFAFAVLFAHALFTLLAARYAELRMASGWFYVGPSWPISLQETMATRVLLTGQAAGLLIIILAVRFFSNRAASNWVSSSVFAVVLLLTSTGSAGLALRYVDALSYMQAIAATNITMVPYGQSLYRELSPYP